MLEFAKIPGLTKIFNRDDWMKVFLACSTLPDYRELQYSSYYITTDATIRSGKLYYEKNALEKGGHSYDPISHILLTNEKKAGVPQSQDYSFGQGDKHEFHEFILAAKVEVLLNGDGTTAHPKVYKKAITEDILFTQFNTYYYDDGLGSDGGATYHNPYNIILGGDKLKRGYTASGDPIVYCHIDSWQSWEQKDGTTVLRGRFTAGWKDSGYTNADVYYMNASGEMVYYTTKITDINKFNAFMNDPVRKASGIYVLHTLPKEVSHFFQVGDIISQTGYTVYDSDVIGNQQIDNSDSIYYYKKVITSSYNTTDTKFRASKRYECVEPALPAAMIHVLEEISEAAYLSKTRAELEAGRYYYVGMKISDYIGIGNEYGVSDEFCDRTIRFDNVNVTRGSNITTDMVINNFGGYMYIAKVTKVNEQTSIVSDIETTLYTVNYNYGVLNRVTYMTNGTKIADAAFGEPSDLKFRKTGVYYVKSSRTDALEAGYVILDSSQYTVGRRISDWEQETGKKVYTLNNDFYIADPDISGQSTHGHEWYERAGTNYPYEGFVALTTEASSNAAKGSLFLCKRKTYQLTEDMIHGYTGEGAAAVSKAYYQYDTQNGVYVKVPTDSKPMFRNTEGSSYIQTTSDTYFRIPTAKTYYADILCQTELRGGTKEQYEAHPELYDYYYSTTEKEEDGMRVDAYSGPVYDREREIYWKRGEWDFVQESTRFGITTDTEWSAISTGSTYEKQYYFYAGSNYSFNHIDSTDRYSVVSDSIFGYADFSNDYYYGYTKLIAGTVEEVSAGKADYVPGSTTVADIVQSRANVNVRQEDTEHHTLGTDLPGTTKLDDTHIYHVRNLEHVPYITSGTCTSEYCKYSAGDRKITENQISVKYDDIGTYIGFTVYGEYKHMITDPSELSELITYYYMADPTNAVWGDKFALFEMNFAPTVSSDTTVQAGKEYYTREKDYQISTDSRWVASKSYYKLVGENGMRIKYLGTADETEVPSVSGTDTYDLNATYTPAECYVYKDKTGYPTLDKFWDSDQFYYRPATWVATKITPAVGSVCQVNYFVHQGYSAAAERDLYVQPNPSGISTIKVQAGVTYYTLTIKSWNMVAYIRTDRAPKEGIASGVYYYDSPGYKYTKVDLPVGTEKPEEAVWYEFTDTYYGHLINSQARIIYRKGSTGTIPTECTIYVQYQGQNAPEATAGNRFRDGEELPNDVDLYVVSKLGESILPDEYYEECYGLYYWDQFFLDHGISATPITNVRSFFTGKTPTNPSSVLPEETGSFYLQWTDPTLMVKKDDTTATPDAWNRTTIELCRMESSVLVKDCILVSTSCSEYSDIPIKFDWNDLHTVNYSMQDGSIVQGTSVSRESAWKYFTEGWVEITAISNTGMTSVYRIRPSMVVWTQTSHIQFIDLATGNDVDGNTTALSGKAIPGAVYLNEDLSVRVDAFERVTEVVDQPLMAYSKSCPVIKVTTSGGGVRTYQAIIVGDGAVEGLPIPFTTLAPNEKLCTVTTTKAEVTIQELIAKGYGPVLFEIGSEISVPSPVTITPVPATETTTLDKAMVVDIDSVSPVRDIEMGYETTTLPTVIGGRYYMRASATTTETYDDTGNYNYVEVPVPVGISMPSGTLYMQTGMPHIQFYVRTMYDPTDPGSQENKFEKIRYDQPGWDTVLENPGNVIYTRDTSVSNGGYIEYDASKHSVSFRSLVQLSGTNSRFDTRTDAGHPSARWNDCSLRQQINKSSYVVASNVPDRKVPDTTITYYIQKLENENTNSDYFQSVSLSDPTYFDHDEGASDYYFKAAYTYFKFVGFVGGTKEADAFYKAIKTVRNYSIGRKVVTAEYALTSDTIYQADKTYYRYDATQPVGSQYIALIPGGDYEIGDPIEGEVYEHFNPPVVKEFENQYSDICKDKIWIPSMNQIGMPSMTSPDPSLYIGSFPVPEENSILAGFSYEAYTRVLASYPALAGGMGPAKGYNYWRKDPKILPRTGTAQPYWTRTSVDYNTSVSTTEGYPLSAYAAVVTATGNATSMYVNDSNPPKTFVYFTFA